MVALGLEMQQARDELRVVHSSLKQAKDDLKRKSMTAAQSKAKEALQKRKARRVSAFGSSASNAVA